ncbi:MAG TPA: D-hexose-6-phosphate mutarotase [Gemmatimonadaceae bacterium]
MSVHDPVVDEPVQLRRGIGGLPKVTLRARDGATADVYLHGGHVTSWRPAPDLEERLFLSARSAFRADEAIRGGIPVIFPQFATEGPLPRHGFARTSEWRAERSERTADGHALASFVLTDSPETRAIWPAEFRATISVRVGGVRLVVRLTVENTGTAPFTFTTALHTYVRVHDIEETDIVGLRGTRYRESSNPTLLRLDDAAAVRVTHEIDRVYVGAPHEVRVREPHRTLVVTTEQFPDLVLWNPGAERAAAMADMEPDGERAMLCVEAAAVQKPVALGAGERWHGTQTLDATLTTPPATRVRRTPAGP